jgi:hypothetical protein
VQLGGTGSNSDIDIDIDMTRTITGGCPAMANSWKDVLDAFPLLFRAMSAITI